MRIPNIHYSIIHCEVIGMISLGLEVLVNRLIATHISHHIFRDLRLLLRYNIREVFEVYLFEL